MYHEWKKLLKDTSIDHWQGYMYKCDTRVSRCADTIALPIHTSNHEFCPHVQDNNEGELEVLIKKMTRGVRQES